MILYVENFILLCITKTDGSELKSAYPVVSELDCSLNRCFCIEQTHMNNVSAIMEETGCCRTSLSVWRYTGGY